MFQQLNSFNFQANKSSQSDVIQSVDRATFNLHGVF